MARPQRRFKVILSPKFPDKIQGKINKNFKKNFRKAVNRITENALRLIKQNTPVRTGRTRDAWTSTFKVKSTNVSAEITLRNPLPAAIIQDRGAKASVGRYVPVLGRRIRTGMHPGIMGTKYIDRTAKKVKNDGKEELRKLMNQTKRDFGKIRPRRGGQ